MDKKDHCTGFPEYWVTWKFNKVYIGDCCKIHDSECNTMNFIKCLYRNNVIGATAIAAVAASACLIRYFKV